MAEQIIGIFLFLFDAVLRFYYWLAIIHIVLSWLFSFQIINPTSPMMGRVMYFINSLLSPIYDWIYQFLRPIGGGIIGMIDLRPLLFILFLYMFQPMVHSFAYQLLLFIEGR